MQKKPTVTGIAVFLGLFAGLGIGLYLPYPPSLETLAGGVIGGAFGFLIDKLWRPSSADSDM